MAATNESDYELLTEHFNYPPVSLLDDIINTINVLADRALDSVERLLLSIPPKNLGFKASSKNPSATASPEDLAKREIENGTHQLETLLNAAIDKNFDIFELYTMQNILTVKPKDQPFMQLAHYRGLDLTMARSQDRATVESVTALRRRLRASQKLHVSLEAERVRNDALLRKLKGALGVKLPDSDGEVKKEEDATSETKNENVLGFLREKGNLEQGGTDRPITTTTEFTLSQLQALRDLSASLRTLLPKLGPDELNASRQMEADAAAGASWRRERAEYIEGASRNYLQRSGSLELGPHGEVRDGEWQGGGRAFAKNEVEGLEQVASLLAAASADEEPKGDDDHVMGES